MRVSTLRTFCNFLCCCMCRSYELAIQLLRANLALFMEENWTDLLALTCVKIGRCYVALGDFHNAIMSTLERLKELSKHGESSVI